MSCLFILAGVQNARGQISDLVNNLNTTLTAFTSLPPFASAQQSFTLGNNGFNVTAVIVRLALSPGHEATASSADIYLDNTFLNTVVVTSGSFMNYQVSASATFAANSTHQVTVVSQGNVDWGIGGASASGSGTIGTGLDNQNQAISGKYKLAVGGSAITVALPVIAFANPDNHPDQPEGTGGSTPFVFSLVRTGSNTGVSTVNWAVTGFGQNPADAADFVGNSFPSGVVTFAAGETTKDITVLVNGDSVVEPDEGFLLTLSAPVGATISTANQNFATIRNDDAPSFPLLSIAATDADKAEGNTGSAPATPFTFTVTRSGNLTVAVNVDWAVDVVGYPFPTVNDFVPTHAFGYPHGTLNFAANETSKVITVGVVGDAVVEPDMQFKVTLSNPTANGVINTATAFGKIHDDDVNLTVTALSANRSEGNSGAKPFTFTVARIAQGSPTNAMTTVNWAVSGSSSSPAVVSATTADFAGNAFPNGTVTFNAGEMEKVIGVLVNGNTLIEPDREFTVTLSNPSSGATITTATALGTIHDDDAHPAIVDTLGNNIFNFFTVQPGTNYALSFTTENQAYQLSSVELKISAGFGTSTILTELRSDQAAVPGALVESWSVTTSDFFAVVTNVSVGLPRLTASTKYWLVFTPSGNPIDLVTGQPADNWGTATLNEQIPGFLGLMNVTPLVAVRGPTIASLVPSFAVSATSADQAEGNAGLTPFTFTITRSGVLTNANSVDWVVAGSGVQPASADDFAGGVFPSGTVTFAIGDVAKTITVNVAGDLVAEPDETFTVTLANATAGALITGATATGIIRADDVDLQLEALSADQPENAVGPFRFQVRRIGATTGVTTVQWAVTGGALNPANAADFAGGVLPSGTVTFNPGDTLQPININVQNDSEVEADESFVVTLANPSAGARLTVASVGGIIRNDDVAIAIAALDADKPEGNSGATSFTFQLTRTGALAGSTTVNFAVVGSGANPANGTDFVGGVLPQGQVTFNPGEASKTLTISVQGDAASEPDETFTVTLANPTGGATLSTATATGTIRNDDAPPGPLIVSSFNNNPTGGSDPVAQPDTLSQAFTTGPQDAVLGSVSLRLFAQFNGPVTVDVLLLADDGPVRLDMFAQMMVPTPGTVLATVGTAQVTSLGGGALTLDEITVQAISNVTLRANTKYWIGVHPTAPMGALVGVDSWLDANPVQGVGTMSSLGGNLFHSLNGFQLGGSFLEVRAAAAAPVPLLAITANSADKPEGNAGLTSFTFTITRSGATSASTTVNWAVTGTGGSPADAADFENGVLPGGLVTFAAGETSKDLTVNVRGDTDVEPDKNFVVTLSGATGNANLIGPTAAGVIRNDDTTMAIAAKDADKPEGTGGNTPFVFTITRLGKLDVQHSVNWAVTGTGPFPADLNDFAGGVLPSGTVTFAQGESSKDVTVLVNADADNERDETFTLTLSAASPGVTLTTATATGSIRNDDPLVITVSGGNIQIVWGNGPAQSSGFALEATTSLIPPVIWAAVQEQPTVNNGQASTTLPVQGKGRFFRLRKLP